MNPGRETKRFRWHTGFLAVVGLFFTFVARASVTIKIVDWPSHVYLYYPIDVLIEVKNESPTDMIVPTLPEASAGWSVLTSTNGGEYVNAAIASGVWCGLGSRRLAPGEKWLFLEEIGQKISATGTVRARAVLRGDSHWVREAKPDLRPAKSGREVEVFEGEVHSSDVEIQVVRPRTASDLAAEEFIKKRFGTMPGLLGLIKVGPQLQQSFADSHYALAEYLMARNWNVKSFEAARQLVVARDPTTEVVRFLGAEWAAQLLETAAAEGRPVDSAIPIPLQDLGLSPALREYVERKREDLRQVAQRTTVPR